MDSFQQEIENLKIDLIKKYNDLGMKASGEWERQLEYFIKYTEKMVLVEYFGLNYTEYLTKGRKGGAFPPINAIRKWIDDKGITPKDKISKDSLAFLIARKIAQEGTRYFKQGGTDLIDGVITQERINTIAEAYGRSILTKFTLDINQQLQRIA